MIVQSFNGFDLSSTNYRARIVGLYNLARSSNGFVQLSNTFPQDAGVYQIEPRTIPLDVRVQNYANRETLIQALLAAMQPGTLGDLIVTFPGDGDYRMECRVESIAQDEADSLKFVIMLNAGDSTWRKVTQSNDSWIVTANGATKVLNVDGSLVTALSLILTPTLGVVSGYKYQQLYQLVNAQGIDYLTRPWCITINTAALITAGKMRADCADLRIFKNDTEVKRWISGANTTTTKVWFNVPIGRGFSLDLATSVPSTGAVGELRFKATANNLAALKLLPANGILQHGTEWFQYNGVSPASYRVAIVRRGALGTAQQAHAIGDVFKYIQNAVFVVYGDASAIEPSTSDEHYDDDKPMFDLALSDNSSWVYSASSGFYDATRPSRPGGWSVSVKRAGDVSKAYTIAQDAESGNPAMGSLFGCYNQYGRAQPETASILWSLSCPGGFSQVSATGSKYRNTSRWPVLAGLQKSSDAATWVTVWNEATPVNLSTWTAINQALKAVAGKHVRFAFSGSFAALADAKAYFEILTCQVWFTSANLPTGTLLGEATNYPLNVKIENKTTGDTLSIVYPMQLGDSFSLDGELNTAMCGGINSHGAISLDDESRSIWLRLAPGANTLEITADVIGTLDIDLSWYARRA